MSKYMTVSLIFVIFASMTTAVEAHTLRGGVVKGSSTARRRRLQAVAKNPNSNSSQPNTADRNSDNNTATAKTAAKMGKLAITKGIKNARASKISKKQGTNTKTNTNASAKQGNFAKGSDNITPSFSFSSPSEVPILTQTACLHSFQCLRMHGDTSFCTPQRLCVMLPVDT